MHKKNYYQLLNITPNASKKEIKLAFRELAKQFHPDKNFGSKSSEESFKEIQEAYSVLFDEVKRKRYDLKLKYELYYTIYSPRKNTASKPADSYNSNRKPKSASKKDTTEKMQMLLSFFVALILLYFIISYSEQKFFSKETNVSKYEYAISQKKMKAPKQNSPSIENADSPYDSYFGEAIYNESKNSITINNRGVSEIVICLVQKNSPGKTIRNEYLKENVTYKMARIPDGAYYLKIYCGKNWNPNKILLDGIIHGAFETSQGFYVSDNEDDLIIMKQEMRGSNLIYSTYESYLDSTTFKNAKSVTAEEFFK